MPVIAQYRFGGSDLGLLAIAFPQVRVVRPPYYPFLADGRIIVADEQDPFRPYPEKQIIQIISTAEIQLDSKEGFLRFLASRGLDATEDQLQQLWDMDGEWFWCQAKYACALNSLANIPKVYPPCEYSTVLDLFECLFENFGAVYRHYERLRPRPNNAQLVSALMTMMVKTEAPEKVSGSWRYRKILQKNRQYRRHFQRAVLQYIENELPLNSTMTDLHFLAFASECSEHTRPDTFHLPDDITLESMDMYIQFGFDPRTYGAASLTDQSREPRDAREVPGTPTETN
jgi:hypothetical protein